MSPLSSSSSPCYGTSQPPLPSPLTSWPVGFYPPYAPEPTENSPTSTKLKPASSLAEEEEEEEEEEEKEDSSSSNSPSSSRPS